MKILRLAYGSATADSRPREAAFFSACEATPRLAAVIAFDGWPVSEAPTTM